MYRPVGHERIGMETVVVVFALVLERERDVFGVRPWWRGFSLVRFGPLFPLLMQSECSVGW